VRPRCLKHGLLECLSAFGAALSKACGNDDRRPGAALAKSGNNAGGALWRRGDDGKIRRPGEARDIGIAALALDLGMSRVDQMIGPEKPPSRRFRCTTAPTVDGSSLAPISATDAGLNRQSRLRTVML
jgi:hypothetical protein